MNRVMDSMIRELSRGNPNYLLSKFWQTLDAIPGPASA